MLDAGSSKRRGESEAWRGGPRWGLGTRALALKVSGLWRAQRNTCGWWICLLLSSSLPHCPSQRCPLALIPDPSARSCSPPSSEPPEPHDLQAWLGPEALQLRRQSREGGVWRGSVSEICRTTSWFHLFGERVCAGPWGHRGWTVRWRPRGMGGQRLPSGALGRRGLSKSKF